MIMAGAALTSREQQKAAARLKAAAQTEQEMVEEVNQSGTSRSLEETTERGTPRRMHRGYVASKHRLAAHRPSALKQAVTRGDIHLVHHLLLTGGEGANITDEYGFTPLFLAAFDGHYDIITLLVEHGGKVNKTMPSGNTPLYAASSEGHADIVIYLIERGASVNHRLCDRSTPLHAACSEGHSEVAHILILAGADIHAVDDEGYTPLCYAAKKGDFNSVQLLVESGADVKHKSYKTGFTALHEVNSVAGLETSTVLDISHYLLQHGADVNAEDNKGNVCLFTCAQTLASCTSKDMDLRALQYLIDSGAEVNHVSVERDTALQECAYNGCVQTARCLLDNGAEIDGRDTDQMTPLHYSADNGYYKVSELLINRGADINAVGKKGYTPLSLACNIDDMAFDFKINYPLVKFLVARGAHVDARAEDGCTALHVLLYRVVSVRYELPYELLDVMEHFLRAGCHVDIPDARGKTVLEYVNWLQRGILRPVHDEVWDFVTAVRARCLPLPLSCLTARVVGKCKLLSKPGLHPAYRKAYGPLIDLHMPKC